MHAAVIPALDRELRESVGLDVQTYDVLLHVYESGDAGVRMTDLASRLVLSKSGTTTVVDRLEARGWARRVPDADDRRATRITLTDQGAKAFRDAAEVHLAGIQRRLADLVSDQEAHVIADVMRRVIEAIDEPEP